MYIENVDLRNTEKHFWSFCVAIFFWQFIVILNSDLQFFIFVKLSNFVIDIHTQLRALILLLKPVIVYWLTFKYTTKFSSIQTEFNFFNVHVIYFEIRSFCKFRSYHPEILDAY